MGRPRSYTPEALEAKLMKELPNVDVKLAYDYGTIADKIGVNRSTLFNYMADERYTKSKEILANFSKNMIMNKALSGEYNGTVSIFLMKANYKMMEEDRRRELEIKEKQAKEGIKVDLGDDMIKAIGITVADFETKR